ncbi:uncharacterized protein BDV17DRAFT_212013 [Aspergillus undulatus]|uniref:uncharacterized protein n=1 Tax=Aspergillus undulatus TaxID=1810928 RepID=UPI003CCD4FA7
MFSTQQHTPPVIPPSPTLSNPDMILPFDDNERENSTPSPPFNLPSLSHLQSIYESRTNYSNANGYNNLDPTRHNAPRAPKKAFPRHTWMHEGHDAASRRLSDIGEEDSASPYRHGILKNAQAQGMARQSRVLESPAELHESDAENRAHSSSSSSTISGASETSSWEGTKGRAPDYVAAEESRGSRNDRERRAAPGPTSNGGQTSANLPSANEAGGPDEDLSAVILESEAERILENAKRRLSLMEGNLTRARSSKRSTTPSQSSSPVPTSSPGLGQPVGGLYQSIHRAADRRSSMLRPRNTYSAQDTTNNRHSRVYSETHLPSGQSIVQADPSRSVSAMGTSTNSNFYNDERSFHYAPTRAYLTHRASASSIQQHSSMPSRKVRASSDSPPVYEEEEEEEGMSIHNMDDFNSAYPTLDPPSRSQSQLQVRDLRDQMKGLHIKISTLKVKAQEDGLRRRSLQSLRTPSPLTAATHWYANPLEHTNRHSNSHLSAEYGQHFQSPLQSPMDSQFGGSGHAPSSNTNSAILVPETLSSEPRSSSDGDILPPFELTDHEDDHSAAESLYEDAEEEIDREALEEILREPLDDDLAEGLDDFTSVHQVDDTPHEDREDAFDYEHFILHSALGNYTQARTRRPSNASETSVETTRPIKERRSIRSMRSSRSMRHSRSNSGNSISTVATFATAAEGNSDVESVLYWDRKFNDEIERRYAEEQDSDPDTPHSNSPDPERTRRTKSKSKSRHLTVETASQRPDSAATGSATPTSLASSLVSTVRAAASPRPNSTNSHLGINEDDTKLLEHLFKSLGDVCMNLQELTVSEDHDEKQAKLLRRRLEAARRVLDGELD